MSNWRQKVTEKVKQKEEDRDANKKTDSILSANSVKTNWRDSVSQRVAAKGLNLDTLSDDLNSIPIISDIPFLGRLLGHTNQSTQRTEMLVLVTGYIVDEKGKVEDMIKRYNQAVKALSKFEGEIAEAHKIDLEREERIRKEKAEKKLKQEAEKARKEAEKARLEAEKKQAAEAAEKLNSKSVKAPEAADAVKKDK